MKTLTKTTSTIIILIALMLLIIGSDAMAITKKGDKFTGREWSFQIVRDGIIDNDEIEGVRFSLNRRISKDRSIRFNLGITENNSYSRDHYFQVDNYGFSFQEVGSFDVSSVNLSVHHLFGPDRKKGTRFYWGIGPKLTVEETDPDLIVFYHPNFAYDWVDYIDCQQSTMVGLGMETVFGMEWSLGRNVSFLTEYGVSLQQQWYLYKLDYYDNAGGRFSERETFDDGVHLNASHIRFGLGFYF